jgi:fatty acid desaturase
VRSDLQGSLHIFAHLLLLGLTGVLSFNFFYADCYVLAAILLFFHGTFYSFLGWAGASHELSHRTVFKTRIVNDFFLVLFSFLTWNNYFYFRASHTRHHQYTVFANLDGESSVLQTIRNVDWLWSLGLNLPAAFRAISIIIENSRGVIQGRWGNSLFLNKQKKMRNNVFVWARIVLYGHLFLAVIFIASGSWFLLLLITFAPFIANWLNKLLALTQHCGMQGNVTDFRLNSRTVLLDPFLAFIYWQMNYHIEHHMFPGVPFYQLKALHKLLAADFPPPCNGIWAVSKILIIGKLQG